MNTCPLGAPPAAWQGPKFIRVEFTRKSAPTRPWRDPVSVFSKAGMSLERPEIDDATQVDPL
jgi:hypothetical protein